MNSTLSKMLMFAAGAAIGSVVTWKLVRTKYEQIANEEIESMREYYAEKRGKQQSDDEYGEEADEDDTEARVEYEAIVHGNGYAGDASENNEEDTKMEVDGKPYIITPEDYDESDYTTETLEYYEGDDVLVDAYGDVIENREDVVGTDFVSHFGENEGDGDTVYVRNDEQEIDYEICRDLRSYSEVY